MMKKKTGTSKVIRDSKFISKSNSKKGGWITQSATSEVSDGMMAMQYAIQGGSGLPRVLNHEKMLKGVKASSSKRRKR